MMTFAQPLALLLALPAFALAFFIWRRGYINLSPRREKVALGVRLVLLTLLILGLAGATLQLPSSRQATVVVADLSNSDYGQKSLMAGEINAFAAGRPSNADLGVVTAGQEPMVEDPPSNISTFDTFQTSVNRDYTNLERALELAGAIMPDGYRKRVVLLSDGQQNAGDGLLAARLLRAEGVRVDVSPIRVPGGPEVMVDRVDVPGQLLPRERFSLVVSIRSNVDTRTGINLYRDHTFVGSRTVIVHPGENSYAFAQPPLRPGFHSYQVDITPDADTLPQNNTGSAFTTVTGAQRILVIAAVPHEADSVMAGLRSTGLPADLEMPFQVVPTLSNLERYGAVVIVDTAVDVLGPDLVAQLVPYVRDLGRGLVVIGGQESYGMGGYGQTPLEQALPVSMDLPKRKDLPSAAVILIVESLEADVQINISKEAAKGVVDLLTERDQVGINDAIDYGPGAGSYAVPLQYVRNKARIDSQIDQMQPGDPMSYVSFLQSAYNELKHTRARIKHIILLGDGDAEDPSYESVVKKIRAGGVTVSSVATNGLGYADFNTMENIARWGGGRYYRADDVNTIPKIFLREARTVARSGVIEGKFYPQELSANPMLRDLRTVPPLYGYVATTPKPTGEMVLVSNKLDPVLAGWQFGLGRSVAWTSDAAGLWTKSWLAAPDANRFWANLVSWTLPSSQAHHLFVATGTSGGQGQVAADIPSSLGPDPGVIARVLDPKLHPTTIQLQPAAPGRFTGSFPANSQGPYFVTVEARGAGHAEAGQAGLDVPFSAEYRTSGTNYAFLRALARAGGGTVASDPRTTWLDTLNPAFARSSLAPWLWLLALLLLPADIGIRRLVVTRRDFAVIMDALPFRRRYTPGEKPAVAPLSAVRARRAQPSRPERQVPRSADASSEVFLANVPGRERIGEAKPAPAPKVAPKPPAEGVPSTTSQLLASKRRKK
ncbi:MAG: VWA domain-containing protein [Chloroflexota bacterium]|nr:VWA domain-containing protein [Chloroflexota bacterium]